MHEFEYFIVLYSRYEYVGRRHYYFRFGVFFFEHEYTAFDFSLYEFEMKVNFTESSDDNEC